MFQKRRAAARRQSFHTAAAALLGLAVVLAGGTALLGPAVQARTARGPEQVGGTWDAVWRNASGETRKGLILVEQRGAQLSARIQTHGDVTAAGSIAGSAFTLRGTRLGVPFTITGRVQGRKMAGTLTAILVEREFTATRRRGR